MVVCRKIDKQGLLHLGATANTENFMYILYLAKIYSLMFMNEESRHSKSCKKLRIYDALSKQIVSKRNYMTNRKPHWRLLDVLYICFSKTDHIVLIRRPIVKNQNMIFCDLGRPTLPQMY